MRRMTWWAAFVQFGCSCNDADVHLDVDRQREGFRGLAPYPVSVDLRARRCREDERTSQGSLLLFTLSVVHDD